MQAFSIFPRRWMTGKAAFTGLALLCLLAAPSQSPAQDAGVSGIAPGPANARGLNGSISNPSGAGNPSSVPAIPPPSTAPILPPAAASPSTSYRPAPVRGVARITRYNRTRYAGPRSRRSAKQEAIDRIAVKENDKLIDRKVLSICRGC
jgi:hypothetical protein